MRLRNFKSVYVLLFASLIVSSAQALDTLSLLGDGPSRTLLVMKKPIYAETTGSVPVKFPDALVVFEQPDLLQSVQDAYCELIAENGKPEFTIEQTSTNTYFYINRKNERTDITEVLRERTSETAVDVIYYSVGERFFGKYEAVIHVQITDDDGEHTHYTASVYAYPENAFSRFFARRLGLVERFFRNKTSEMTGLITQITYNLCGGVDGESTVAQEGPKSSVANAAL